MMHILSTKGKGFSVKVVNDGYITEKFIVPLQQGIIKQIILE